MIQSIEEKIRQRRLQILVHSCIYYKYNENIISDAKWNEWAKELVQLQTDYPEQSKSVDRYEDFKDFDGSTGFNLPLDDEWVNYKANQLLRLKQQPKKMVNKTTIKKKKLF